MYIRMYVHIMYPGYSWTAQLKAVAYNSLGRNVPTAQSSTIVIDLIMINDCVTTLIMSWRNEGLISFVLP